MTAANTPLAMAPLRLHDAVRDGDEAETCASVKALVLAWNVIARSE